MFKENGRDIMNGKVLKVVQYNLEFGAKDRYVNVFGCFRYLPNGNLYLLYADVDMKYNIVYYGSGHVKGSSVLVMQCRSLEEVEIIKEYIFKVTNGDNLDNFEMISLDMIEGIEIIASAKLDVKPDILLKMVDIIIPKKEEVVEIVKKEEKVVKEKKKKSKKLLLILIILLVVCGTFYFFFMRETSSDVAKQIVCEKKYNHDTLKATVEEISAYNFNVKDILERIDTTMTYSFSEEDYQKFILKGTYYRYLPDDDNDGGYKLDDNNYQFKVIMKKEVDISYNKPTAYEEVLTYYKGQGYTCTEEIIGE